MNIAVLQLRQADKATGDTGASGLRAAPELSIVIPTFNEAGNARLVVAALDRALQGIAWEVLFVDDDSADGTAREVFALGKYDNRVRCIRRLDRRGLSGATIERA